MSLESTLTQLKNKIESTITDYGESGITPPSHLLEMRYYLLGGSSNSSEENGGDVATENTLAEVSDQLDTAIARLIETRDRLPLNLGSTGGLKVEVVAGSTGGGSSSDASAAKQDDQIAMLEALSNNFGDFSEVAATTDTATDSSFIRLFKRLLTKIPFFTLVGNALKVDGSAVTQPVSGTVGINNFPETQAISAASLPLPVFAATDSTLQQIRDRLSSGGSASAENQATQTIRLEQIRDRLPDLGAASEDTLTNLKTVIGDTTDIPASDTTDAGLIKLIKGIFQKFTATVNGLKVDGSGVIQPVSGAVSVTNLPATQPVNGTVSISNFPTISLVNGTVSISNLPATQAVSVANFPVVQQINGSVEIENFPPTQPVSGSVSVLNFPTTQSISAASLPLPTGAATENTLFNVRDRLPSTLGSTGGLKVEVVASVERSIIPSISHIVLVNPDQEYSINLTTIKKLSFKGISGGGIRYSYEPGRVGDSLLPYYPLATGGEEREDFPSLFTGILYLATNVANTVVVIKTWGQASNQPPPVLQHNLSFDFSQSNHILVGAIL